jgi:hypothetical protein
LKNSHLALGVRYKMLPLVMVIILFIILTIGQINPPLFDLSFLPKMKHVWIFRAMCGIFLKELEGYTMFLFKGG